MVLFDWLVKKQTFLIFIEVSISASGPKYVHVMASVHSLKSGLGLVAVYAMCSGTKGKVLEGAGCG